MPKRERCGDCCQAVILVFNAPSGAAEDFAYWLNNHRNIKAMIRTDGRLEVLIDEPCEHLLIVDGEATCLIHSAKPKICANNYNCKDSVEFLRYRKEKFGR